MLQANAFILVEGLLCSRVCKFHQEKYTSSAYQDFSMKITVLLDLMPYSQVDVY